MDKSVAEVAGEDMVGATTVNEGVAAAADEDAAG